MKKKINSLEELELEMKKLELEMDFTAKAFKDSLSRSKNVALNWTSIKSISPVLINGAIKWGMHSAVSSLETPDNSQNDKSTSMWQSLTSYFLEEIFWPLATQWISSTKEPTKENPITSPLITNN